jgi:hypothetical protein
MKNENNPSPSAEGFESMLADESLREFSAIYRRIEEEKLSPEHNALRKQFDQRMQTLTQRNTSKA